MDNIEMPQGFRKFSHEYLVLRRQQDFFAHSKQYAAANDAKTKADELESTEHERQEANWLRSVSQQRDILIQKQMQQRAVLEEKFERKWSELIPAARSEVSRARNAVRAAKVKLSDGISESSNGSVLPPLKMQPRAGIGVRMRLVNYQVKVGRPHIKPSRALLA
jgi:hypothetical protein